MAGDTIAMAVIGAGRIGKIHAENLAYRIPRARLLSVADANFAAARELAGSFDACRSTGDYRAVLDRADIDAVVIATPATTHVEIIIEAARAGKHIFCEKPIDFDLQRIDRALAAALQSEVKFQVGFNRRFDPDFCRLRKWLDEGRIGETHVLRITSRDPQPPPISYISTSGGLFLDMAIHDFDLARFLLQDEVASLTATGSVLIDPAIEALGDVDTAVTTLKFKHGAIATIDNSRRAAYGYDQRVELFGSGGMAFCGNLPGHTCVINDARGSHAAKAGSTQFGRYEAAYRRELEAFVECALEGKPPAATGQDGRQATLLGLAAKCSCVEGRTVSLDQFS